MATTTGGAKHVPGTYAKPRPDAAELANNYIREWDERRREWGEAARQAVYPPSICFSRKAGVAALEIADILGERLGYRVVDKEILEYVAGKAKLSEKTASLFDERYPGKIGEFLSMAFGEKAFTQSDYTKHLFGAVFSIAGLGPTIFVGRGVHLLLPRENVFAVRFISSREHRIRRLAEVLSMKEEEAEGKLDQIDREQRAFFKEVYGKRDASPYEFDMVINYDYIWDSRGAAEIVEKAFREKFRSA